MELGKLIENVIGTVSAVLFIALVIGSIIAPFFESYIITHPRLRKMVEYFGNVTLPHPPTLLPKSKTTHQ